MEKHCQQVQVFLNVDIGAVPFHGYASQGTVETNARGFRQLAGPRRGQVTLSHVGANMRSPSPRAA